MKHLLYILILLMLITPVSAITYSDEYYKLGEQADVGVSFVSNLIDRMADRNNMYDARLQLSQFYELRRQTILMEKQNELLEEQNGLLRNMSATKYHCEMVDLGSYRPHDCVAVV